MRYPSAFVLLLIATASAPARAQEAAPARPAIALAVDREYADSLAMNSGHAYTIHLPARQFVAGAVEQETVDVVITVYGPDGRLVGSFDGPGRGPEPFQFASHAAGRYRIQVAPFEQEQGRYRLQVRRVEPAATTPAGKVNQLMAPYGDGQSPGAAILVVRGGQVVLSSAYGMANVEHGIPITPKTVFDLASLAKQFTGMSIAMLAERGALSLDDDVRKYLPDMPDFGRPVTIRHLVHHTAGLRDWVGSANLAGVRSEDVLTYNDVLQMARRQRELNFEPGSETSYTNTGYVLLAKVVEVVTGQTFADWTRDNLFGPLGMTSTHFATDHRAVIAGRAQSYSRGPAGQLRNAADNLAVPGSSSIYSTVDDLGRWMVNFGRMSVGSARVHEMMRRPGALNGGAMTNYAFGVEVDSARGLRRLSHSGSWAGFSTFLAYYPEIDAGVVVLANLSTFPAWTTANDVAEIFFGDRMTPRQAPAAASFQPAPTTSWAPSASELAAFAGRYHSPELETAYTVAVRDGKLVALHPRNGELALTAMDRDVFRAPAPLYGPIAFQRDARGAVTGMRVTSGRLRDVIFIRQPAP